MFEAARESLITRGRARGPGYWSLSLVAFRVVSASQVEVEDYGVHGIDVSAFGAAAGDYLVLGDRAEVLA